MATAILSFHRIHTTLLILHGVGTRILVGEIRGALIHFILRTVSMEAVSTETISMAIITYGTTALTTTSKLWMRVAVPEPIITTG